MDTVSKKALQALLSRAFLLLSATCLVHPEAQSWLPVLPADVRLEETVGPFASWANAKDTYGAKGDGTTDDTVALQHALDDIGKSNTSDVLYLPSGIYRVSATLNLRYKIHISIIGQDPDTTIISWRGPVGGIMMLVNGVTQSRWERITWDGTGTAGGGVAHQWDRKGGYAPTNLEHADEVFRSLAKGIIGGGHGGANDDSVTISRCRFLSCSRAGISLESPNALNYWIWDSEFIENARGVTNEFGRGNFLIYRSLFRKSSVADITTYGTQYFSFRGNTSIGSRQFFHAIEAGQNAAPVTIQDNRIVNTENPIAIEVGNLGLLLMLDNQIRSRPGSVGPVVRMASWAQGGDLISIGNSYTVENPIAVRTNSARWWSQDDVVVSRVRISGSTPGLPRTLPRLNRKVFDLKPGLNAVAIQEAINRAAELAGGRPVVHLPKGNYILDRTISVPAGADVQIVGDGYGTQLQWSGSAMGVMFELHGPSKATFRELCLAANNATGISIDNPDQPGSRLHTEGLFQEFAHQHNVLAEHLKYTSVDLQSHQMSHLSGISVKAVGTGGAGSSRIALFGASTGADRTGMDPLYEVTDGGRILIEDAWYEGGSSRFIYATNSGTVTANGLHIAPVSEAPVEPIINIDDFTGTFTCVGVDFDFHGMNRTIQVGDKNGRTKALFLGLNLDGPNYFSLLSSGGKMIFANNKRCGAPPPPAVDAGCYQVPNKGDHRSSADIRSMLAQLRTTRPDLPTILASGITDVRLYRLNIKNPSIGIYIGAAVAPGSDSSELGRSSKL